MTTNQTSVTGFQQHEKYIEPSARLEMACYTVFFYTELHFMSVDYFIECYTVSCVGGTFIKAPSIISPSFCSDNLTGLVPTAVC